MDYRIGTLLNTFGLLPKNEIDSALKVAQETRLPIGRVLVMFEKISHLSLKAVIDAQWMLKDDLLTLEQAREAIDMVRRKQWSFTDALVSMGIDAYASRGTRLGELLAASGQVNTDEVDDYLKVSNQSGLPLGRVLWLLDKVSQPALDSTLRFQHDIRLGTLDRELGINLIKEASQSAKSNTVSAAVGKKTYLLGELLALAGAVQRSEIDIALEISLANNKMLGEVLTEHGFIDDRLLEQALEVQTRVRKGEISGQQAINSLQANMAAQDAEGQSKSLEKNLSLYEFLRLTGYMTPARLGDVIGCITQNPGLLKEIQVDESQGLKQAIKTAITDSAAFAKLLDKTNPVDTDKAIFVEASRLLEQVRKSEIALDRSIIQFTLMRTGSYLSPSSASSPSSSSS